MVTMDMVKPALFASLVALCGCMATVHGLVEPAPAGSRVVLPDGQRVRLVQIDGAGVDFGALDGYIAEFEGTRVLGTLRVKDWRVREGLHGMTAWVGTLRWMGARLGIEDRNSGSFYLLHGPDINDLRAHLDEVVLVEGYVDGPNTVRIVHWISLQRGVSAGSVDTP